MSSLGRLSFIIITGAASIALLLIAVLLTNPLAIGPVGVTAWFIILFVALSCVATLALYLVKTYFHWHENSASRLRYSSRQGLLIGGWASGVLALSSLRQLGLRDAILLGLLLGIIEVYVRFRWP